MSPLVRRTLSLALASLCLAACGGKGGGAAASGGSSLSLTASEATIAYGESVTIRWVGTNVNSLDTGATNFPVASTQTSSSLVDRPAADTTYTVAAEGSDGETRTRSVTVHVVPSTKKIWLIADQSLAGMPQVTAEIQKLTSTPIQTGLSWPSGAAPADVVMLFESATIGTDDQSSVTSFLSSGGRVVLVGRTPRKLGTGDLDNSDISAIGSWFAGATAQTGNAFSGVTAPVVSTSPGIPLGAPLYGKRTEVAAAAAPLAGSAILLTEVDFQSRSEFFVYTPPIGGRLGVLGDYGGGSTEADVTLNGLTAAVVRWAADGG